MIIIIKRGAAAGKGEGVGIGRRSVACSNARDARHHRSAVGCVGHWVVELAGEAAACKFFKRPTTPGNFDQRHPETPGCFRPLFPTQVPRAAIFGRETGKLPKFSDRSFRKVGELRSETGNLPKFQNRVSCDLGELGLETWACFQFWNFRP